MKRILCLIILHLVVPAGEPASAEGPMDWTVGEWSGVRRAAEDGSEAPLSLLVEHLPGGRGVIERLEVETDGDPYVGFMVCLRDPKTGYWMRVYANDVRPKFARLVGRLGGDRVIWRSVTATPPRASRLVSERLGPDHWRRTQEVSTDGGKSWQVLFVDEVEKKRSGPD